MHFGQLGIIARRQLPHIVFPDPPRRRDLPITAMMMMASTSTARTTMAMMADVSTGRIS
jgi:hypothetical protein